MAPASILRTHANTTLYLDRESAALLDAGELRGEILENKRMQIELPGCSISR